MGSHTGQEIPGSQHITDRNGEQTELLQGEFFVPTGDLSLQSIIKYSTKWTFQSRIGLAALGHKQ